MNLDFQYLFTSFEGRINRAKYWAGTIILAVISIVLGFVIGAIFGASTFGAILIVLITLALFYPGYAVAAKRFQDRDKPGITALYGLVPVLIASLLQAFGLTGTPQEPNALGWICTLITMGVGLWFLIELGILKGTPGPNRFGGDPWPPSLGSPVAVRQAHGGLATPRALCTDMTALGDKAVQLSQSLIRCESVTPADAGALDVLIQALKPGRFTFWRLNFKDEDTPPVDNLYARVGEGPPQSLLRRPCRCGAAGRGQAWTHPPFAAEIANGLLYGRGAADMKGAIACFTAAALDYVKARGREIDGSISLLITGDEEGPLDQRHAQGARLDEGARASSPTIASSASRPTPSGSAKRSRSAGAAA